jgi:hypothetical protein
MCPQKGDTRPEETKKKAAEETKKKNCSAATCAEEIRGVKSACTYLAAPKFWAPDKKLILFFAIIFNCIFPSTSCYQL